MKLLITVLLVVALLCSPATSAVEGLQIHFLDVGQADAAIMLCDDEVMMIDGGNANDSQLIYSYLKNTLQIEHIDYIVATHPHEDHVGGLPAVLNACTIGTIYSPVLDYDNDSFQTLKRYAEKQDIPIEYPPVETSFFLGTARVQVLGPSVIYDNVNDMSIILKIVYDDIMFLFMGDAEATAEHVMLEEGRNLQANLLKVGHHGSSSSSTKVFLDAIEPQVAIISVGEDNAYGHPSVDVINRLTEMGTVVLRTDLNGHIVCYCDGDKITIEYER